MTRDADPSCVDCCFYRHVSSTMWTGVGEARKVALGECRRRAPFGFLTVTNGWPYVNDSGWCGEFKGENAVPNKLGDQIIFPDGSLPSPEGFRPSDPNSGCYFAPREEGSGDDPRL